MARDPDRSAKDNQTSPLASRSLWEQAAYEGLSELELEQAADELLQESIAAMGRGEYPFYSDSWVRQLGEHDANLPAADHSSPTEPKYLSQACLRLLTQTKMKPEYRSAIRLTIKGATVREVAQQLNSSPAQASRWIKAGLARLAGAAYKLEAMLNEREAIQAVWREETSRYSLHQERHCKSGQEACRITGLCTRRWYLMYEE